MKYNEYVTSDTHFGHANIINYCSRPFKSVEEMDEFLIKQWNLVVPPNAVIYHLGDFSFGDPEKYLRRLNGIKRLVKGNHDKKKIKSAHHKYFDWVNDYYESKTPNGDLIVMCHYPFQSWNKSYHGSWSLHGHCHGTMPSKNIRRLDVGVDCHNFAPISYEQVKVYMESQPKPCLEKKT